MKLSLVAPELRRAAMFMSLPLPLGSGLGREVVRRLLARVPEVRQNDVAVEVPVGMTPAVRVFRPKIQRSRAALLWIHGGGFVIGQPSQDDAFCIDAARRLGIVVVAAGYRLAPEHPFPAPLNDCRAAWAWLQGAADALNVDPRRVAIGGQSAGGGLAASLVQVVHDAGGVQPVAQWLFCPMLDDRTAARRELDQVRHRVWNNRLNAIGWRSFLAKEPGINSLPAYAAAARREDVSGLPPTWIGVGGIDLFCEEDKIYADRLSQAGVAVSFEVVPGAPHGFEAWAPKTALARRLITGAQDWLAARLGVEQAAASAGGSPNGQLS